MVFAGDHEGEVPLATASGGGLTVEQAMTNGPDPLYNPYSSMGNQWNGGWRLFYRNNVFPIGTMTRQGYVGSPKNLWCADFARELWLRDYRSGRRVVNGRVFFYDFQENRDIWQRYTSGLPSFGGTWHAFSGISHFFMNFELRRRPSERYPDRFHPQRKMDLTLAWIANNWDNDDHNTPYGNASPILISCATASQGHIDDGVGYGHDRKGVNAVFFDGSARWIPLEEIQRRSSHSNPFQNHDPYYAHSPMHKWARKHATLLPP
jgi:hypothetical protein